jgi:UDP-glucose 4-epimerase
MDDFFPGRCVLILGGLGFIGSNLALRLVECGADVTLMDSLIPQHGGNEYNIEPIRHQVRVSRADIRDQQELAEHVSGQDVIFSLAAQVGHLESMRDPLTDLDINCRAQLSLLECCRVQNPAAKIVFASTRQVYGRAQRLPLDEQHPIVPVDVNGVSKRSAEMFYALYHHVHRLRTVTLRLTSTYGPRLNLRGESTGFIGVFLRRALSNAPIEVYGDGTQRRDFNYVDDVVDALLLAATRDEVDGREFNLGHDRNYSVLEVAQVLNRQVGVPFRIVPFPADRLAIDPGDTFCDYASFRRATGWTPRVDLEEGFARTLEFFRRHRTHYWEPYHDSGV